LVMSETGRAVARTTGGKACFQAVFFGSTILSDRRKG